MTLIEQRNDDGIREVVGIDRAYEPLKQLKQAERHLRQPERSLGG